MIYNNLASFFSRHTNTYLSVLFRNTILFTTKEAVLFILIQYIRTKIYLYLVSYALQSFVHKICPEKR